MCIVAVAVVIVCLHGLAATPTHTPAGRYFGRSQHHVITAHSGMGRTGAFASLRPGPSLYRYVQAKPDTLEPAWAGAAYAYVHMHACAALCPQPTSTSTWPRALCPPLLRPSPPPLPTHTHSHKHSHKHTLARAHTHCASPHPEGTKQ